MAAQPNPISDLGRVMRRAGRVSCPGAARDSCDVSFVIFRASHAHCGRALTAKRASPFHTHRVTKRAKRIGLPDGAEDVSRPPAGRGACAGRRLRQKRAPAPPPSGFDAQPAPASKDACLSPREPPGQPPGNGCSRTKSPATATATRGAMRRDWADTTSWGQAPIAPPASNAKEPRAAHTRTAVQAATPWGCRRGVCYQVDVTDTMRRIAMQVHRGLHCDDESTARASRLAAAPPPSVWQLCRRVISCPLASCVRKRSDNHERASSHHIPRVCLGAALDRMSTDGDRPCICCMCKCIHVYRQTAAAHPRGGGRRTEKKQRTANFGTRSARRESSASARCVAMRRQRQTEPYRKRRGRGAQVEGPAERGAPALRNPSAPPSAPSPHSAPQPKSAPGKRSVSFTSEPCACVFGPKSARSDFGPTMGDPHHRHGPSSLLSLASAASTLPAAR